MCITTWLWKHKTVASVSNVFWQWTRMIQFKSEVGQHLYLCHFSPHWPAIVQHNKAPPLRCQSFPDPWARSSLQATGCNPGFKCSCAPQPTSKLKPMLKVSDTCQLMVTNTIKMSNLIEIISYPFKNPCIQFVTTVHNCNRLNTAISYTALVKCTKLQNNIHIDSNTKSPILIKPLFKQLFVL